MSMRGFKKFIKFRVRRRYVYIPFVAVIIAAVLLMGGGYVLARLALSGGNGSGSGGLSYVVHDHAIDGKWSGPWSLLELYGTPADNSMLIVMLGLTPKGSASLEGIEVYGGGLTWTLQTVDDSSEGELTSAAIWTAPVTTGGLTTVTLLFPNSVFAGSWGASLIEVTGHDTSDPIGGVASLANGASDGPETLVLSSAPAEDSYVFAFMHMHGSSSGTFGVEPGGDFIEESELGETSPTQGYSQLQVRTGSTSELVEWEDVQTGSMVTYSSGLSAIEIKAAQGGSSSVGPAIRLGSGLNGLVGHWKFDGNAKDATPYGNDGTVDNASLTADRYGRPDSAYLLGGGGTAISVGSPSVLSETTGAFTYSVWIMRTADSTYQWPQIMGALDTHVHYGVRALDYGETIVFEYGIDPYGGAVWNQTVKNTLPINEWHHLAITYDGSTVRQYWDGQPQQARLNVSLNPSYGGLYFGSWEGSVDDARVYNRPLSDTEVKRLFDEYNSQISISSLSKGLVFDMNMNGNAKDATPYGNNGVLENGPALVTDRKGRANSAYAFVPSESQYITIPDSDALSPAEITSSAWVYPSSNEIGTAYQIFSKNGNNEWRYRVNPLTRTVSVFDRGATNSLATIDTIPLDQWSHIAFTGDSSGIKIYINGVLSRSGGAAWGPPNTSGSAYIGTYNGDNEFFSGYIDDVRVWNRSLSAAEIKAVYDLYR